MDRNSTDDERNADRFCFRSLFMSLCVLVKQVQGGKKRFCNLVSVPHQAVKDNYGTEIVFYFIL